MAGARVTTVPKVVAGREVLRSGAEAARLETLEPLPVLDAIFLTGLDLDDEARWLVAGP